MHYRSQFTASRFGHYAHRMAAWLSGDPLHQAIREGHGRITPMMWNFTPFDGDWPFDEEIHHLLQMEEQLGAVPRWAIDIAVQVDALPHCGQVNFPQPVFAICQGIGCEHPDAAFLFCFEACSSTKSRAERYASILESWCVGQTASVCQSRWVEETPFVTQVFASLSHSTELKRALVGYIAIYLRLLAEQLTTNDDGMLSIQTGTSALDTRVAEQRGVVEEVAHRTGFDAHQFFSEMEHPWLCHQRVWEQMLTTLARIGREESDYDREQSRQAAAPFAQRMRQVYDTSIQVLSCWLAGETPPRFLREQAETAEIVAHAYDVLGEPTPVKRWLVASFRKKMQLFRNDDLEGTLSV